MPRATAIAGLPVIRRRRPSNTSREKTSLSIRADVLEAAKEIVRAGEAENLSAFVEEALEEKLRRTKRAALYEAYETAAQDPDFMRDMGGISNAFDAATRDGL